MKKSSKTKSGALDTLQKAAADVIRNGEIAESILAAACLYRLRLSTEGKLTSKKISLAKPVVRMLKTISGHMRLSQEELLGAVLIRDCIRNGLL